MSSCTARWNEYVSACDTIAWIQAWELKVEVVRFADEKDHLREEFEISTESQLEDACCGVGEAEADLNEKYFFYRS